MSKYIKTMSLVLTVALAGCVGAPTVKMSAEERLAIKSVKIKPDVQMPAEMFLSDRAKSFSAVGGLVGEMAASESAKNQRSMQDFMATNKISVPDVLINEFKKTMEKTTPFKIAPNNSNADTELALVVNVYGLGQTQGFSALLYPTLTVSATLTKQDGRIIWQKSDFVTPQSSENKQGHSMEEYMNNPELMKTTWQNAAGIVSRLILADLATNQ